jgi:hydrogenase maturation protease
MMTDHNCAETLVLGIGNPLWADEGFGVRVVEALHAAYDFPPQVQLMDGGTQGLFLLPFVQAARHLLILDAIDYGLAPGELKVVRGDDVPRYMGAKKVSMHQTGFQEVLASAALLGGGPERMTLIGVQPAELDDYGGSLRPVVRARIPEAVALAVAELERWGVVVEARKAAPAEPISPPPMSMAPYESGRPAGQAR